MSPTFASLKYFNYRIWFAAALVANVGTWIQRVAQDWLVLRELTEGSGTAVGVVTGLQFVPVLFLSTYAGLIADRVDRRKLLMCTQGLLGVLALALGVMTLTGVVELWHVYVFAFLLGCVSAFDNPARQVFVSEMVPADKLPNAVGLNSASFNAARLIGPGVAGLMIEVMGTGWAFIVNGVSFAATIAAMALMRKSELRATPKSSREKGQIREGIRYVRNRTDIVIIMVVVSVVSTFGLNFQLTSALMATNEFGKGAGEYGILGSILAIGSLAGALMAARRQRPRVRLVVMAAFGFGIATGLLAMAPTYEAYALLSIPVGFCSLTMMTAANAAIQMSVEPQMRGRVMALYMIVFLGATPIGSPFVGWVGEQFGARWAVGIGSITALTVAIWAAAWTRRRWHYSVTYDLWHSPRITISYEPDGDGTLTERAKVEHGVELARVQRREVSDSLKIQELQNEKQKG
jgi:MFS family permease